MSTIPDFVRALPQDADGLLRALSARIDDEMLREIASADYGQGIDQHFAPLVEFRDTGVFPASWAYWHPMECLELIRWSQPDDPDWRPSGKGLRGHWMRAFSCATALRYWGEIENLGGENGVAMSVAPLAESLVRLGGVHESELAAFLSWLCSKLEREMPKGDWPVIGAALLAAGTAHPNALTDVQITEMAARIYDAVRNAEDERWMFEGQWLKLGRLLVALDFSSRPQAVASEVRRAAAELERPLSPEERRRCDEATAKIKKEINARINKAT